MWDEEWAKLVDVLMKVHSSIQLSIDYVSFQMCLESDEAVFVVDLLPIFMGKKYTFFRILVAYHWVKDIRFYLKTGQNYSIETSQKVPNFWLIA